jgi:hypothetical protein
VGRPPLVSLPAEAHPLFSAVVVARCSPGAPTVGPIQAQAAETTPERPPSERVRGESAKAYESFRRYRDAGPGRSLAGCRSIERRWSWRWRWAERAGEWDSELWRRQDEATLAAAGSSRRALELVEPLAELDAGEPRETVLRQLERGT